MAMPGRLYRIAREEISRQRAHIAHYGLPNWLRLKDRRIRSWLSGRELLGRLASPFSKYPLGFRPGSSDLLVFDQIFIQREYSCLDDLEGVDFVVDCGANVGYASAYFLSRFPECSVVAIEPDYDNYELLRRNLSPYSNRTRAVHGGVWSSAAAWLKPVEVPYRDGREWSYQFVKCDSADEAAIPAVDIGTLLRESGAERISLLKMDIEGAEAVVFGASDISWLDRVDNIAIELHDDSAFGDATRIFSAAMAGRGFASGLSGELTICRRLTTP
jgi:FkbM family methyltransferase